MPKRKRKKYSRPRRPFDKTRITEENVLVEKYGLKNKREIWKSDAAIGRIRNLAKQLITKSEEEKKTFVEKLQKKGFKVESIADALALDKEDWLKRRLQTIVHTKKLTNTPKQARQLVTHRHVKVGSQVVNKPSFQVSLENEGKVELTLALKLKPIVPAKKLDKQDVVKGEEKSNEEKVEVVEENAKEIDKEESQEDKESVEEKTE